MKKIILVFAFLISGFIAQAQELNWYTDMSKATEASLKENKPLLLFFTGSDWCGWCTKLQKDVLKTTEFANWAMQNVILVELDFPRRTPQDQNLKMQNQQLAQTFGIQGYPTVWFVNPIKGEDNQVNLTGLGSLGYDKSATTWIANANTFLPKK
ncbi:thioredoxin fold domain-containing protein [Flavobacterium sp. F372]|uniref:Thioredoxin family protein n=1 Tax=Flavobacterium bernardetii TaxID=2813823 RepID=A0ABR7J152_9FLAO|nr:thioredoxin family protein [Flavobacterium bernardetii]MBC5835683.1 thioredoxin family protein [Flavobacterium bernardetii]NHF71047.1 thioredoxin fold domain-containing protein [Flavobacterium bernardetii]